MTKENLSVKIKHEVESKSPFGLTEREKYQRKTVNLRPETLEGVYEWIDSQVEEKELVNALKRIAARYPNQALAQFKINFKTYLESIIMAKRR